VSILETPGALLTRTQLRELGLERRAIDVVFRSLPTVRLPGYSRPMVRAADYLELLERCTSHETSEPAPASWALITPREPRETGRPDSSGNGHERAESGE
jgi:hypothetical protein